MPHRIVCAAFVVAILSLNSPALATGLPVVESQLAARLADSLRDPVSDSRWQCRPLRSDACPCYESSHHDGQIFVDNLDVASDPAGADRFFVSTQRGWLIGHDLKIDADDSRIELSWGQTYWRPSHPSRPTLNARGASYRETDAGPTIRIDEVRWTSRDEALSPPTSCADFPELPTDAESTAFDAAARSLVFDDHQWTANDLALTGFPASALSSELSADRASPGFLAPSLFIDPDGAHLTATYHFGTIPIGLRGHIGSDQIAGVGVGFWTSSPFCVDNPCPGDQVSIDTYLDTDHQMAAEVTGETIIGTDAVHLSATSDGVGFGANDVRPAPTNRFRTNGHFQGWNAHRIGVSVSGQNHSLAAGGAVFGVGAQSLDLGSDDRRTSDLWTRYATRIDLAESTRADMSLGHREFDATSSQRGRLTSANLRVDHLVGSTRRIWIRPAARAELTAGVVDGDAGPVAGSRPRLDTIVDAGMAFRGRIADWTHHLSPRGYVGRRFNGGDNLPEATRPVGINNPPVEQTDSFHFAGATLEQRLDIDANRRLRVPIGVAVVDDATGQNWRPILHGSFQFDARFGTRRLRLGTDAICVGSCRRLGIRGRFHAHFGDRLQSLHTLGYRLHHRPGLPFFDGRIRSGTADRFAPVEVVGEPGDRLVHRSALRGRFHHWNTDLSLAGPVHRPAYAVTQLTVERHWAQLGWGIGLQMAVVPAQRDWVALVGLRNSPAF